MSNRIFSGISLSLLLIGMATLAFNIQPVKASGTIYIRADGSIDPPTAPISTVDNITYTLTGNINSEADGVVVQRGNIIIDGDGYTLQGTGAYFSKGVDLSGRTNVTVQSVQIKAFYFGVYVYFSSGNTVSGNNITNNGRGVWLESSFNNIVSGNTFTNDGLSVYGFYHNSVENNTVNGKPLVYLEGVADYTVGDAGQVVLVNCTGIRVENLNLSRTSIGVQLWETTNSTIAGNNITANNRYGVGLSHSSGNTVSGNNITANNNYGIWFYRSSTNTVSGNNIANNGEGVYVYASSNYNAVSGNNITGHSVYGVHLWDSYGNIVSGNTFTNNGLAVSYSYHNSVENNTVNGKPLVYLEGVADYTVGDAGQVVLVNCTGIRVENLNLSRTSIGVQLWETTNSTIAGNNITANNRYGVGLGRSSGNTVSGNNITANSNGVYLYESSGNTISGNNITANNIHGVMLSYSSGNTISGNNITNKQFGVHLYFSSGNTVSGNNITNNGCGVWVAYSSDYNTISSNNITANSDEGVRLNNSSNNIFYHNNFVTNTAQVHVTAGYTNVWDDGYPSGGNYWSDYVERYPNASEIDGSGIWDTSYVIDENNQDNYPLMNPWTPAPVHDVAVNNVVPSETKVYEGNIVNINVTVKNEGTVSETFNVSAFYDSNVIQTQTNVTVNPGIETTLTFNWNTSGVPGNHKISAEVSIVPEETDTSDNTFVNGIVEVVARIDTPIKGGQNATIESNVTITKVLVTKNTLHFDASGPSESTGWINVTFPMLNTTAIKVKINKVKLTPPPFPIITTNGTHYFIYFEFTLSTKSIAILFSLEPPIANFTWTPPIPKVNQSVTFDGSSSSADGASIVSYEWDFGDSEHSSGKIVAHTYTTSGFYIVTLNITDSEGFSDIEQKQIQVVQPYGPEARFTATPETALTGESIKFDASASLPGWNGTHGMPITEYRWDFSDGNQTTTYTPIVYHSFSSSGNYYVTLTVYAPGATPETDTISHKVTIIAVPVGGYSIPIKGYTTEKPLTLYLAIAAILTVSFTIAKRRKKQQN